MTETIMPDNIDDVVPKVTTTNVIIDPATAARWLTQNSCNRTIRQPVVSRYARDMATGDWKMTGESIKFDWNDVLRDGQHRLSAIVQSGVTVALPVTRGLDPASQAFMDQGTPRTGADALHLRDFPHTTTLAGAAKLGILWNAGEIRTSTQVWMRPVSHGEILRFLAANPDMVTAAATASRLRKHTRIRPTVLAFTVWITNRRDAAASAVFFATVAESRTDGPGDPRLALIRRIDQSKSGREKTGQISEAYYVIRAWNAWRSHQPMQLLKLTSPSGPSLFPEPA